MKQMNSSHSSRFIIRQVAAIAILAVGGCCVAVASCPRVGLPETSPFLPNVSISDLDPDLKNDLHAAEKYEKAVRKLLDEEKFSELERVAASARVTKARFSGGGWTLYAFYSGLQGPTFSNCGKASEVDWQAHLQKLKRWVSLNPQSITARIALADAYVGYAWQVRGDDYGGAVSSDAWKPFTERIQLAKDTLDDASALEQKCPHWYVVMQQVGRAQGWTLEELTALMERAFSFEPLYYYYYREHAFTLQPRWYGQVGDAERFADYISARIGGMQGASIYFEIATTLNCTGCSEGKSQFARMSWPKIQQGYAATEELYGTSIHKLNEFAHLAIRADDRPVALKLFVRIGDNWDVDTWKKRSYFESSKGWAFVAPPEIEEISKLAANLRTPAGDRYYRQVDSEFQKRHAADVKQCAQAAKDTTVFYVIIKLAKDGSVQELKAWPPTNASTCVLPKLAQEHFAAPPQAPQWIELQAGELPVLSFQTGLPDAGE